MGNKKFYPSKDAIIVRHNVSGSTGMAYVLAEWAHGVNARVPHAVREQRKYAMPVVTQMLEAARKLFTEAGLTADKAVAAWLDANKSRMVVVPFDVSEDEWIKL